MFDNTWKIRRDLCKAYKMFNKKAHSLLNSNLVYHIEEYEQLENIKYGIAYVLCEYFDFNYNFYYECPFSYKWNIAYDYIQYYKECKEAYEKFLKEDNTNYTQEFDLVKPLKGKVTDKQYGIYHDGKFDYGYITTLKKGDIYFDIRNNKQYIFDGKNLLEI